MLSSSSGATKPGGVGLDAVGYVGCDVDINVGSFLLLEYIPACSSQVDDDSAIISLRQVRKKEREKQTHLVVGPRHSHSDLAATPAAPPVLSPSPCGL
jgi:hypothetical protein